MIRGSSREYNWQHIFCNRLSELLNNWKSLVYGYSLDSHWKWNEIVVVECVTGRTRIVSNDTYSAAIVSLTAQLCLPYPYPPCCSFFLRPSYSCSTRTKYAYKYITIHFTFLTVQGLYYFGAVTESLDSSPVNRFFFALRIIYLRKNTNYICSSKFDQNIFF